MELKEKILIGVIMANLVLVDVGVGWLIRNQAKQAKQATQASQATEIVRDECGEKCKEYIDQAIQARQAKQAAEVEEPSPTPTPVVKTVYQAAAPAKKTTQVTYITVPGSGSTTSNDWVELSGTDFYFNPADYSGLVEVYFEANIKLFNGNGRAYVRLFDVTHGIGVQGAGVDTNSQSNVVLTSGKVSFWSGKNLIRVQVKSLTADTAVFSSGRLRIVTEN